MYQTVVLDKMLLMRSLLQKAIRQIGRRFVSSYSQPNPLLHPGEVEAQRRYGTFLPLQRKIGSIIKTRLEPDYAEFVGRQTFFFVATADARGRCDCAFRGIDEKAQKAGYPALIIENETTLLFPDYPGNGLYQTLGNLMTNPHIGMLFIDFSTRQRVRVNGRAEILEDEAEAKARFGPSAQRMIRVQVQEILANCPRRIPLLQHPV